MLKLTAFCPTDQSDAVVATLHDHPRVRNVVRLPAVEVDTGRDVVTAFLPDDRADDVLASLRALQDWEAGDLSLMNVDLIVRHDLAQLDAETGDEDGGGTIGWEMILVRAQAEARLSRQYLTFMACAGLIATFGLVRDMPILIVGAMSLSPDLAPANAIAVTLTVGAFRRMARALATLVVGLSVAMLIAFVVTAALQGIGVLEGGTEAVNDTLTSFVTVVDPVTIFVAITAGVAAMVAFLTDQGLTAVGVAISVTTIPAASYAGVALASGALDLAMDALGVLAVNIVFLVLAQCLTLVLLRAWKARRGQQAAWR
jgi:uncharacterized hydrophobic protein (TIGR00271 family)